MSQFEHISLNTGFADGDSVPTVEPDRGEEKEFADLFEAIGIERAMEVLRERGMIPDSTSAGLDAKLDIGRSILYSIARAGKKTAMKVDIMCLCFDLAGMISMTHVAKQHGVGKGAISKACRIFIKENGLVPSSYMKSEKSSKKYSMTNKPRSTRNNVPHQKK